MSWDFAIMAADEPPPPAEEMADDWAGVPIGTLAETRSKIGFALSDVDWSNPVLGVYEDEDGSYEFNIGNDEPCTNIVVHVRGDEQTLARLVSLAEKWGWYLMDIDQGEWLHHCEPDESENEE